MRRNLLFLLTIVILSCQNHQVGDDVTQQNLTENVDTADFTNNFYDNEETYLLAMTQVEIAGEVQNPGFVDFSKLPTHSLIVKETLPDDSGNKFVGAYRYDGYSLFDILNQCILAKKNQEAFPPIIDVYVVIENAAGEKCVISWGEIYYPNHLNEIIIAKSVMRIVPSKTHELWPLPENCKVVVGTDLLTSRNIEKPVKITIVSAISNLKISKGMQPLFSEKVDVFINNELKLTITNPPQSIPLITYETTFYGRGRGIHSTTPFTGFMVKEALAGLVISEKTSFQNSFLIIGAADGYRAVYTYSEIFNRNDQAELLMIYDPKNNDGGAFRLFPAGDFFSDRAIKAVSSVVFVTE